MATPLRLPAEVLERNCVSPLAVVNAAPQHRAVPAGEPPRADAVALGRGNTVREFAVLAGGMPPRGVTSLGDNNYVMAHAVVDHDCAVGDRCTVCSNASLAGYVTLQDHAYVGMNACVHQHVVVGRHAIVGMGMAATKHVPPYWCLRPRGADGTEDFALNEVGMRRHGYSAEDIAAVRSAYSSEAWPKLAYACGNDRPAYDAATSLIAEMLVDATGSTLFAARRVRRALADFYGACHRRSGAVRAVYTRLPRA